MKWSKITIWGTSKIDSWWYPGLVKKICRYTFFDFWLWIFSLFAHVHFGKDFRNPYQNGMVKNWKNPKSKIEKVFKKYFFYWLGILSGIDFWGPSDSDFLNILIFDFVFFPHFSATPFGRDFGNPYQNGHVQKVKKSQVKNQKMCNDRFFLRARDTIRNRFLLSPR